MAGSRWADLFPGLLSLQGLQLALPLDLQDLCLILGCLQLHLQGTVKLHHSGRSSFIAQHERCLGAIAHVMHRDWLLMPCEP